MTISEALKKYPKIEADLLLAHVLKKSKEFLYLHPQQKLTAKQKLSFDEIAKKRQAGMPAAYLLGYKFSYGLKFRINRSVLIPRPETEWLVDEAIKIMKKKLKASPRKTLKILDVGTGSGCIAISIAKNVDTKKVKVFATDISDRALKVARANTKTNQAKINFSKQDLLVGIKDKFDIIIANLPYVPVSDYKKLYKNLKYEPRLALTDETNKSLLITTLLEQAPKRLKELGTILLEVDPATIQHLKLGDYKIFQDVSGLKRFISTH